MTDLYIMKLGGSVATHKAKNAFSVNSSLVKSAARQIKAAQKRHDFKLIVVNGAGPFGHRNVAEYGINNGLKSRRDFEGFCKTVLDCNFLNQAVASIFWKEGLLAYPIAASAITIQNGKKIQKQDFSVISELFKQNSKIIPVLNGTMCPDTVLKGSVVSGDATIANLAKHLKPKKILLGTDVAGIFTADPKKNRDAKRIGQIDGKNFQAVLLQVGGSSAVDVTGGMRGKLQKIRQELHGATAVVFDARQKNAVLNAVLGKKMDCTKIQL